jgi:hypothetical protein
LLHNLSISGRRRRRVPSSFLQKPHLAIEAVRGDRDFFCHLTTRPCLSQSATCLGQTFHSIYFAVLSPCPARDRETLLPARLPNHTHLWFLLHISSIHRYPSAEGGV